MPVFVDVDVPTYNLDVSQLEAALSPKTRAIMVAHTLGNPFDLDAVTAFCEKHDLWLIEDCCDALGSTYRGKPVGTFGDLATVSFYPAHHITMGEGGCVLTNKGTLKVLAESFRDWGRDCWCEPGKENTCGKRFDWQLGELPRGYDHKYIYSARRLQPEAHRHAGRRRRSPSSTSWTTSSPPAKRNFRRLCDGPRRSRRSYLILPEATPAVDPSWFGFPVGAADGVRRSTATPCCASSTSARSPPGCCSAATWCASPPTWTPSTAASVTCRAPTSSWTTSSGSASIRASPTRCSTT